MIAILISAAVLAQSSGAELGAKIRYESNQMIMRMQNVPYDVADVLNGSNYSVEEATAIAAQRRQQREAELSRQNKAARVAIDAGIRKITKQWTNLDKAYVKIADETFIVPDQERPTLRGRIRSDIADTKKLMEPNTLSS